MIYEFESAAEFGEIMADSGRGYLYTRIRNPSTDELAAVIAELEGARAAHCFASGMGALTAAMAVMAPPGAGVVAAKQIYGQTHRIVNARDDGRLFDIADLDGLREALRGRRARGGRDALEPEPGRGRPAGDLRGRPRRGGDGPRRQHGRNAGELPPARAGERTW